MFPKRPISRICCRGEEKKEDHFQVYQSPVTRPREEPEKTAPTAAEVRSAQKVTGEVMWLLTRSRPDLMYAMSKMCQNTLKNPLEVMEVGNQVMKYLRKTIHQGVEFGVEKGGLEV